MRCHFRMRWFTLLAAVALTTESYGACCYFSAKNADILQPAQKVFLTYDPAEKLETFTVQPKFEGNALDFGMVIPTPTQPKLHEMPKEFFKHLAVYTILKKREAVESRLIWRRLDTYLSTSPQRAEKFMDSRGCEFGPGLPIVLYRQAEQMAACFRDSPASGTWDFRNQLAVV